MNPRHAPAKDEAPTVASGQGFRDQTKTYRADSEGDGASEQAASRFAAMRAHLTAMGWAIHRIDNGHGQEAYWVSRWGQCRTLPDRHALVHFMKQVGCKP